MGCQEIYKLPPPFEKETGCVIFWCICCIVLVTPVRFSWFEPSLTTSTGKWVACFLLVYLTGFVGHAALSWAFQVGSVSNYMSQGVNHSEQWKRWAFACETIFLFFICRFDLSHKVLQWRWQLAATVKFTSSRLLLVYQALCCPHQLNPCIVVFETKPNTSSTLFWFLTFGVF